MAHEIEVVNGKASVMSVRETPWHGLGQILDEAPTPEAAIVAAGLDWRVELHDLKTDDGLAVPGHKAVVRDSDKSVLGVVGDKFTVVQNKDAFGWFQPFLDSGVATLETAGSLRGGRRVWVQAKVTGDPVEIVSGDPVERYILLAHGHDGSLAMRLGFSFVRTICSNTLALAMGDKASKLLRIKHTKNIEAAMGMVRDIMNAAEGEFLATVEQYKALAKVNVNEDDLKAYVRRVFAPKVVTSEEEGDDTSCRRVFDKILPLFQKGRGNDLPGVRGTAWGAYNAANEFLAYERGTSQDVRVDSLFFGEGAKLNQRALDEAVKFVTLGG